MKLTKHIGVDVATGARIALIMTVLPDTEDCLLVFMDRLPNEFKESLAHLMNSVEGQNATNLADVLGRRLHADSGRSFLQALHEFGYLKKAPIDTVEMTPIPSMRIPLRTVLVESKIIKPSVTAQNSEKFNPHNYNAAAANEGEVHGIARNLLVEADMLEQDALRKRELAYQYAPSLRPGATPVVEETATPIDYPFLAPVAQAVEDSSSTVGTETTAIAPETPVANVEAVADIINGYVEPQV